MPRRKDIWRCGIVHQPMAAIIASGRIDSALTWLPEEPAFQFLADPFGWRGVDGTLHIFAEHYDYRHRHGTIMRLSLDEHLSVVERRLCLSEPWHLSYPQIFAGEGATWMLPEAHRSGALTLYRDHGGLADWRPELRIALDCVPVDATILHHQDRWWLFYSPATSKQTKISQLHIAWAERLAGPWIVHPRNPVRVDVTSSRPGGSPQILSGHVVLPVQDCSSTYGGAIRPLWIDRLDEANFSAKAGDAMPVPLSAGAYRDGMHSLTACGEISLVDVKRIDRSARGLALEIRRALGGYG